MTAITFDTISYAKKLKKAGVPDKQAETHVKVTTEIMKDILGDKFATKQDLLLLKANLTLRMGAMIAAGSATVLTLLPIILKLVNVI